MSLTVVNVAVYCATALAFGPELINVFQHLGTISVVVHTHHRQPVVGDHACKEIFRCLNWHDTLRSRNAFYFFLLGASTLLPGDRAFMAYIILFVHALKESIGVETLTVVGKGK